jgi:hypothetical protein
LKIVAALDLKFYTFCKNLDMASTSEENEFDDQAFLPECFLRMKIQKERFEDTLRKIELVRGGGGTEVKIGVT